VPEISAEFSVPPKFSGDVLEKEFSTGWVQTSDLQITNQILSNRFLCYWLQDFLAVSAFTGRDFPVVSVVNGLDFPAVFCCYWPRDFPAVSAVACWDFPALTFQAWECKKSPSRDQKAGIFRPYLWFLVGIFWP
jgi:hypothetical protein